MNSKNGVILIVDDEPNIRTLLAGVLEDEGYAVATAMDTQEAANILADRAVALMLLDVQLPGQDGLSFLHDLQVKNETCPVIMMSGHGTIATAVEATRLGALDFIEKPIQVERLLVSLNNALHLERLKEENTDLRLVLGQGQELIGSSEVMGQLRGQIAQAATAEARVLITGENGTGKELIARALHQGSPRRGKSFIKVNCAAIPSELLESELFGHERGAFTGAVSRRLGKFEQAQGGTLLLDEIGDMNATTQAKLLRVLEEGELERVGGTGTIELDVRVFASTNRDLDQLRQDGEFREDLFHRLKVVPLHSPALRDHPSDIPELANHFLDSFCKNAGRPSKQLTADALHTLEKHPWPGNVRELRNLMERVMIMVPESMVSASIIAGLLGGETLPAADSTAPENLAEYLEQKERAHINRALALAQGNASAAARSLGLDRANFYRRLKKLGLKE